MAFSRSILRMSSCTAASSLWLMVGDVVGGATAWREVLGEWNAGGRRVVSGDCVCKNVFLLFLLLSVVAVVWMLLDDA